MNLAIILGFCALTTPLIGGAGLPAQILLARQETQPPPSAPAPAPPEAPQNTAPSQPAAEPPSGAPPPQSAQEPPKTQPQGSQKTPGTQKPKSAKSSKSSKKKHYHANATTTPAATSPATPEKKVVRNGGTTDPMVQLAPGMSPEQASNQRQNTSQLLGATDANLKQISSRQLNSTQQDSVSQIRKYMEQAKAAEQAGDVQRAQNLASKALLLSNDLVKQ